MAKPIESTPILRGKYALRFVKLMQEKEKKPILSRIDSELMNLIQENEKIFKNIKTTL